MSHPSKELTHSDNPKIQAKIDKMLRRDRRIEHLFRRALHLMERIIAVIAMVALLWALCLEVIEMCTNSAYFEDATNILHNLLTIVVGLEFVRMLIDTTPANILEVLTVAITRHVVLEHEDYWSNLACVACIAGLFAIRRFLVRRHELKEEMVENDD